MGGMNNSSMHPKNKRNEFVAPRQCKRNTSCIQSALAYLLPPPKKKSNFYHRLEMPISNILLRVCFVLTITRSLSEWLYIYPTRILYYTKAMCVFYQTLSTFYCDVWQCYSCTLQYTAKVKGYVYMIISTMYFTLLPLCARIVYDRPLKTICGAGLYCRP